MKSPKEIKRELLKIAASIKLNELNRERDYLLQILDDRKEIKRSILKTAKKKLTRKGTNKGFSYKGKHWTQRPENKDKVRAMTAKGLETKYGHNTETQN